MKDTINLRAHHTTTTFGFQFVLLFLLGCLMPVSALRSQEIRGLEISRSIRHPQNYEVRNLDTWFDTARQLIAYTRVSGFPDGDTLVIYDYEEDAVLSEIWGPGATADIRFVNAEDILYLRADTIFRVTGYPDATTVIPVFSAYPNHVYAFTLSPGFGELAAMVYDGGDWSLEIFDYDTVTGSVGGLAKVVVSFPGELDDYNTSIAYTADGAYIAMNGGYEREYVYILTHDGTELTRVDVPDHGGTWSPVFFRDSTSLKLAVGGGFFGGVIEVIDVDTRSFSHEIPLFPHYTYHLAIDPSGDYMGAGGYDGAFTLLDIAGSDFAEVVTIDSGFVSALAFTADSAYVVTGHGVSGGARLNVFRILRETVGEELILARPLGLFPNPTSGSLWIHEESGADVMVYDAQGKLVNRLIYAGAPIDVSGLPDGQYFLRSNNDGRVAIGQFVKTGY